jgi:hypothetical protein
VNYYYVVKWFVPSAVVNHCGSFPGDLVFRYRLYVIGISEPVLSDLIVLTGTIIEQLAMEPIIVHLVKWNDVFCNYEKISSRKALWASTAPLRFNAK